jgi:hypothetical protein
VETRTLYIDKLTKSIILYVPKYIIKFAIPFCLDCDILSRSLVLDLPKKIILFTTHQNPKVIFELCNANEKGLKDNQGLPSQIKNNNIIEKASLPKQPAELCLFIFKANLVCAKRLTQGELL